MAKIICIMGESGSGKTTSMRNLDPSTTFFIDADKKGLSWKGWKTQYNNENQNYYKGNKPIQILVLMDKINTEQARLFVNGKGVYFLNSSLLLILRFYVKLIANPTLRIQ